MAWIAGPAGTRDSQLDRDQQLVFSDPTVVHIAERFVTVRVSPTHEPQLMSRWNLSVANNLDVVFATPDGKRIDLLPARGVALTDTLITKMLLVFRHCRDQLFETRLRAPLEARSVSEQEARAALELIARLEIVSADETVAAFADRESLRPALRAAAFETLASLSTPTSVDALLERAATDAKAAEALKQCTPEAAEWISESLGGEDSARHLAAYHAVVHICKLRDSRPDRFWEGRNSLVKQAEINRVQQLAARAAQRWRVRYAEYR